MNTRYLEDDDLDTESSRELSLSPSTLLGIFFLLAIICAIFFGFGYSMGKRSAASTATSADNSGTAPLRATGDSKPAPGLANQDEDLTPADAAAAETASLQAKPQPTVVDTAAETPSPRPRLERTATIPPPTPQLKPAVAIKPSAATTPSPAAPPTPTPAPHSAAAGAPALVQIAAVSHQEDADILVSALKRKGYTVAVRHEPQDKLLHVQIGPFPIRKDADTMKQRLSADGYNAIVK
ncbi:MAG TPA: SPOR domain-containing protein [Edaphobacter sp.]|nr:SPOR domain-containing protein [Edaphobacter sp.]